MLLIVLYLVFLIDKVFVVKVKGLCVVAVVSCGCSGVVLPLAYEGLGCCGLDVSCALSDTCLFLVLR